MSIVIVCSYTAKPDKIDACVKHIKAIIADIRANEPNTLRYLPTQGKTNKAEFAFYEEFASEADWHAHAARAPSQAFIAEMDDLIIGGSKNGVKWEIMEPL